MASVCAGSTKFSRLKRSSWVKLRRNHCFLSPFLCGRGGKWCFGDVWVFVRPFLFCIYRCYALWPVGYGSTRTGLSQCCASSWLECRLANSSPHCVLVATANTPLVARREDGSKQLRHVDSSFVPSAWPRRHAQAPSCLGPSSSSRRARLPKQGVFRAAQNLSETKRIPWH